MKKWTLIIGAISSTYFMTCICEKYQVSDGFEAFKRAFPILMVNYIFHWVVMVLLCLPTIIQEAKERCEREEQEKKIKEEREYELQRLTLMLRIQNGGQNQNPT